MTAPVHQALSRRLGEVHADHMEAGQADQPVASVAVGIVGVATRRAAGQLGHGRGPRGQGVW